MIIYLIRHGQSEGNAAKQHQRSTTPLSPLGEVQAAKVAERLKNVALDEIWTSPMTRAVQTANAINHFQQVPVQQITELREIKRPTSFEGKSYSDPELLKAKAALGNSRDFFAADPAAKIEDGESVNDFLNRMKITVKLLEQKAHQESDDFVLCVSTHGFVVSSLFLLIAVGTDITPQAFAHGIAHLRHENTGLSLIKIDKDGQKKGLCYSDFSHL